MTGLPVIYIKQNGEPLVPITARIEWSSKGIIIPRLYWTPDGTLYKVFPSEAVPLAFLKDRCEGLRFKVRSEIIETCEPYSELLHTRYETYLYLADRRFYEKNVIDERYAHAQKHYISVTLDYFPDGDYELVYFWVHDTRYKVEKTIEVEPRGSFHAGGAGLWHKVEARLVNADNDEDPDPNKSICRLAAIYLEFNKWFVPVANSS